MGNSPSRGQHHQQHQQQHQEKIQASQQSSSSSSPYTGSPQRNHIDQQRRGSVPLAHQHHHHHLFHHPQPSEPAKPVLQTQGFSPNQTGAGTQKPQEHVSVSSRAVDPTQLFTEPDYNPGGPRGRREGEPSARRQAQPLQFPVRTDTVEPAPEDPVTGGGLGESQKRMSMQSTTTVEEDDGPVDEGRTIPTLVTWLHGGNKVYITGTFCEWRKKYKLSKSPENNVMSAVVPLPAGTHHVKFLVDGELRTSDSLPTAVDSTGILVNYLEVVADELLAPLERQPSHDNMTEGFFITRPRQRYTDSIPAFLRDFEDRQERYGSQYQVKVPPPPTLPLQLAKVILNTNSQLKDDNSVLGIPNHVVLNHLATSSIKNQVLAVSATTRYKKKYVSTILYKSTTE